MYQEYQTQAFIASSPNGWMNTELTLQWVENVIRAFSFKQKLLAWDFKECNIEDTAKMLLATKKIDTVTVPGGYAKYLQVPKMKKTLSKTHLSLMLKKLMNLVSRLIK